MDIVIVAGVLAPAVGVALYLLATRPCKSRIHRHRHWRFRSHHY